MTLHYICRHHCSHFFAAVIRKATRSFSRGGQNKTVDTKQTQATNSSICSAIGGKSRPKTTSPLGESSFCLLWQWLSSELIMLFNRQRRNVNSVVCKCSTVCYCFNLAKPTKMGLSVKWKYLMRQHSISVFLNSVVCALICPFMGSHAVPGGHSQHHSDCVWETDSWNACSMVWPALGSKHSGHCVLLGTTLHLANVVFWKDWCHVAITPRWWWCRASCPWMLVDVNY